METARKGRKSNPEYDGLPRELCCKCGKKTSIGPALLIKKAALAGKTPQEYADGYECRSCRPKKGPSGPSKILCTGECGKEKGTTPAQFIKQVAKSGLSEEEFIKTYKCRSCRKNG